MTWSPVERTDVIVRGLVPGRPGLLDVELHLDAAPPPEWARWLQRPTGHPVPTGLHRPLVHGHRIALRVPDDRLLTDVATIDARIAAANRWYAAEVLPGLLGRQQRAAAEAEATDARVAAAQAAVEP